MSNNVGLTAAEEIYWEHTDKHYWKIDPDGKALVNQCPECLQVFSWLYLRSLVQGFATEGSPYIDRVNTTARKAVRDHVCGGPL